MKYVSYLTLLLLIAACQSRNEYKYIQINYEQIGTSVQQVEDKPVSIFAATDSEAYVIAFEKLCISQRAIEDVAETTSLFFKAPFSFKLLNEKGDNIIGARFEGRDSIEASIRKKIDALEGSNNSSAKNENNAPQVDSVAIKELSKYFTIKKDEFDKNGKTWYIPRSAPKYTNANGIFCYFEVVNGKADNFRFKIQYHAEDWLFIQRVQFSIDGNAYEYMPLDMETDSGNGGFIWEWFDENVRSSDIPLIEALASAKDAKMKLQGRQYFDIKKISKDQILNIKRSLTLYKAMGGSF